ncbi:MoxR family ATPase [Nocardioides sp. zg-536]|uniref:MoxR family ATPase n=1 Tax=Nocardioides faecalis TaxID=2803858 RepID=A0A938YCA7_9ACTN|nr:MoxR family ATPase [Nocardioides faecalis]MBM9461715.1 MoxR family ATPase [Nocardioides faecalis]MBS4754147.1 MoxR family ATPase [Nocardioides faecalis]QVI60148.1 MoxR family ATPase [Nocardioides faecalis]
MTLTPEQSQWFAGTFAQLVANVERAVVGKTHVVRLAFTALLAEGHLLLEDYPGTGKTSLARAMALTLRGTQQRIQFTPDLLPSDVTGVTIYDQAAQRFEFRRGPVFANIVLADEINRASPKTQSALLEVMEENQVTVDGVTHPVGRPFMVIATQNPIEQAGTYRLPEAQLDRFLMKTSLGYPDHASTVAILANPKAGRHGSGLDAIISAEHVVSMIELAEQVHTDPALLGYVARLCEETRNAPDVQLGCSVRAGLGLVRAARVWAAGSGRDYVVPDDVKALAVPVLAHRMVIDPEEEFRGLTSEQVVQRILGSVPAPQERALA